MFNLRLLFVAIIWGINFSVVKFALADFSPLSFTITRFFLSALFLFCVMAATGERPAVPREDRLPFIRLGLVGITLYNIFFMYGLKYTSASHSALLISMSPLFAALIQALIGRERPSLPTVAGLGLAASGVYLVIGTHGPGISSPAGMTGDLLTICASFCWALYTIMAKPLVERHAPVKVTAYSMLAGSVLLLPLGAGELTRQAWASVAAGSWAALAFAAILSGGVGFSLWYQGVKRIGVTRTIAYHYLVPFVAVVFATLFLGEGITPLQAAGGGAILGGVAVVQRRRISSGTPPGSAVDASP